MPRMNITEPKIRQAIDAWFGPTPPPALVAAFDTFQGVTVFERQTPVKKGPRRIALACGEMHRGWWERKGRDLTLPFSAQPNAAWEGARAVGFATTRDEALALLFPGEQRHVVTEKGVIQTALGSALRIQIERADKSPMGFRDVWEAFEHAYPGKWALQCFPPREHLFDQANRYHLHVFDACPDGLDLFQTNAKDKA